MDSRVQLTPRSIAYRIFWLGRYIERAEDNARLLDTTFYSGIDSGDSDPAAEGIEWQGVLNSLGLRESYARTGRVITGKNVAEYIIRGENNSSSLLRCIESARENANGAAPDDIFVELNKLYLRIKGISMDEIWKIGLHQFIGEIIRSIHAVGGMIDRIWA